MTPEEYCRNKAAPPGSNLYYATLYHAPRNRRKLHALFAFQHELNEIICASSDPGAARVTLHWWFEEIERLSSDAARHPVTRELSQLDAMDYLSQRELMTCVAATAQFLDAPESESHRDWLARHAAASGLIWQAAGRACGCADQEQLTTLSGAGCCHGAFELLHHIRHFAALGLNILPSGLLRAHDLALETLCNGEGGARFFSELFNLLQDDIQTGLSELEGKDGDKLLFAVIMLKILDALCREYRRASAPITQARISLTPIRKLWVAWRTANTSRQRAQGRRES